MICYRSAPTTPLMGYSASGVAGGYGLGFPLTVLRDAVETIRY
jgi:hypothetical protein